MLRTGLVWAFPQKPELDYSRLAKISRKSRARPLGTLNRLLRKHYSVDAAFASLLDDFIEDRNTLVHNILDLPGFGLSDDSGRLTAITFANRVRQRARAIRGALTPLIESWSTVVTNAKDMSWWPEYHASAGVQGVGTIEIGTLSETPNKRMQRTRLARAKKPRR